MKTLYLDQFAISNMADNCSQWADIRPLLNELIAKGVVLINNGYINE